MRRLVITIIIYSLCSCGRNKSVNNMGKNNMVDSTSFTVKKNKWDKDEVAVVVQMETQKNLEKEIVKELLFNMENKFELMMDSNTVAPVFCQPVASGNSKKFIYIVSFDVSNTRSDKKDGRLRVLPNKLVHSTQDFKIQ